MQTLVLQQFHWLPTSNGIESKVATVHTLNRTPVLLSDNFVPLTSDSCNNHAVHLTSPGVLSVMQVPQYGTISSLTFVYS